MTLDTEEQRAMLLECLNAVSVPGSVTETHAELKKAVANAPLDRPVAELAPIREKK